MGEHALPGRSPEDAAQEDSRGHQKAWRPARMFDLRLVRRGGHGTRIGDLASVSQPGAARKSTESCCKAIAALAPRFASVARGNPLKGAADRAYPPTPARLGFCQLAHSVCQPSSFMRHGAIVPESCGFEEQDPRMIPCSPSVFRHAMRPGISAEVILSGKVNRSLTTPPGGSNVGMATAAPPTLMFSSLTSSTSRPTQ